MDADGKTQKRLHIFFLFKMNVESINANNSDLRHGLEFDCN